MSEPLIVTCAPNGARKTKADHPALPITSKEIADCAASILSAGASIIHLHVRDESGGHSLDPDRYCSAIDAIHDTVGERLVVQVTTEACGIYSAAEQMAVVRELRPESASVALREICPDDDAETVAAEFYRWMRQERVVAQHILYSPAEVERFSALRERGVIPDDRPFVLYVLGRYTDDLTGDVSELPEFVANGAANSVWSVCCFGRTEYDAAVAASGSGGHVRVGFENNLHTKDGSVADDNSVLVEQAAAAGVAAGRQIASADDVRERFR